MSNQTEALRQLLDAHNNSATLLGALTQISLLTHLGGEVAEYADVVEAVRRLHAVNAELLEALRLTSIDCQHLHHAAGDRHSLLEVCPVVVRINAAIARAEGEV